MNDAFKQEFLTFTKTKLHPAVAGIAGKKRAGLRLGLIAAVVCFLVAAIASYAFLAPYRDVMKQSNIMVWPLIFLAPTALAILVFSLVFVLNLRKTVTEFRNTMMDCLARFIDAGIECDSDSPLTQDQIAASRLFGEGQNVTIGPERFRGRIGDAHIEFVEIGVTDAQGKEKADTVKTGLYMTAHYERPFPYPFFIYPAGENVSIGELQKALASDGYETPGGLVRVDLRGRQFLLPAVVENGVDWIGSRELSARLDEAKIMNGGELYLSAHDKGMCLTMLAPGKGKKKVGIFEGFDVDRCREFCRDARLAIRVAKKCGERQNIIARSSLS